MDDKVRVSIFLDRDFVSEMDRFMKVKGISSRSAFFEKAGRHMMAYDELENNRELQSIVKDAMNIIAEKNSTTLAKSLFRYAVGLDMLTRMMASKFKFTKDQIKDIKGEAINNVRRTKGRIHIEDIAAGYYNKDGDEEFELMLVRKND